MAQAVPAEVRHLLREAAALDMDAASTPRRPVPRGCRNLFTTASSHARATRAIGAVGAVGRLSGVASSSAPPSPWASKAPASTGPSWHSLTDVFLLGPSRTADGLEYG